MLRSSLQICLLLILAWWGQPFPRMMFPSRRIMSSTELPMSPHAEPFIVKLKESSTYLMNKRVLSKALQKLALPLPSFRQLIVLRTIIEACRHLLSLLGTVKPC